MRLNSTKTKMPTWKALHNTLSTATRPTYTKVFQNTIRPLMWQPTSWLMKKAKEWQKLGSLKIPSVVITIVSTASLTSNHLLKCRCINNYRLTLQIITPTSVAIRWCSAMTLKWRDTIKELGQWLLMQEVKTTSRAVLLVNAIATKRCMKQSTMSSHFNFSNSTDISEVSSAFRVLIQKREKTARSWKSVSESKDLCTLFVSQF